MRIMTLKVTGKISKKEYECTGCGLLKIRETNHFGEVYPYCDFCNEITVWKCNEEIPEGWETPESWKIAKLGDICEIT